jgi:hypothetical protein
MTPIGLKLQINYSDQNESFKDYLPRSGSISRQVSIQDWVGDWFVFALDEPFEYQIKTDKPFYFKVAEIDHFLIRSRIHGRPISSSEQNHLDILLDPKNSIDSLERLSSVDFILACWGITSPSSK